MTRMRWLTIASLAPAMAACALAQPDDLTRELGRYDAAHASEEGGSCQSPQLASLTELEGDLVKVRHTDYAPDEDATEWRYVFHKPVKCTGTGERRWSRPRSAWRWSA